MQYHRVAVSVGDEDRQIDRRDTLEQRVVRDAPGAHGVYRAWRVCQVVGSSRSVVLPKIRAAACCPASRLAFEGARKTSRYPCGFVSGWPTARSPPVPSRACLPRPAVPRTRARRAAAGRGGSARSLARRSCRSRTEQVDSLQAHRLDEGDRLLGHLFDGVRSRAGRRADTVVVEGNHPSIRSERVDEGRIPVVEVPSEVLQQDERTSPSPGRGTRTRSLSRGDPSYRRLGVHRSISVRVERCAGSLEDVFARVGVSVVP